MAAMRAELAKVASMLGQLRAGAQLERAARADRIVVRPEIDFHTLQTVSGQAFECRLVLRQTAGGALQLGARQGRPPGGEPEDRVACWTVQGHRLSVQLVLTGATHASETACLMALCNVRRDGCAVL